MNSANPNLLEDVIFTATPTDADGLVTTPILAWSADPSLGTLVPAADTLSCRLVTAPGVLSGSVTATTPEGVTGSATVTRSAGVTAAIGLDAAVVPKA